MKKNKGLQWMARLPKASMLARRNAKRWPRIANRYKTEFDIHSVAPTKTYRSFIAGFEPKKVGPFKIKIQKASHEAHLMFALTKRAGKKVGHVLKRKYNIAGKEVRMPQRIAEYEVRLPSNLFRVKFALTSAIEPGLDHPIDRGNQAAVCAVMGWQGPSVRKYSRHLEYVKEANEALGEPWQNFLLKEIVKTAKARGMQAVALLRPEYNSDISKEKLIAVGLDAGRLAGIKTQFYAAARKAGLKKVKGSKYFWVFFPENREG